MTGRIILHITHVAGSRMISQGTDGLFHGDFSMGVMTGQPMISFVPLHLSTVEHSVTILAWV
jgi:hypothetical protein